MASRDDIPKFLQAYTFKSNPTKIDTDRDDESDKIDDRPLVPFKSPVVLAHGILSNTRNGWGADTYVWNNAAASALLSSKDNEGEFLVDVSKEDTYTKSRDYQSGVTLHYDNIDLQYIRKVKSGEFASYLEKKGYTRNKYLHAFNWEANWHVASAANEFKSYLNSLTEFLLNDPSIDITRYTDASLKHIPEFTLIGHSAGGLVSRYVIENLYSSSDEFKIAKLITIGTPHYGSNAYKNGGLCGTVMQDLDRDDSYLFYSNNKNLGWCGRPDGSPAFSHNQHGVDYYGITGVVTDNWYNGKALLTEIPEVSNSKDLFTYFQSIFRSQTGQAYPDLENSGTGIEDEGGDRYSFGDRYVTGGSGLGLPADFQLENDPNLQPVSFVKKYLYFGPESETYHTNINHQNVTFLNIYKLMKTN